MYADPTLDHKPELLEQRGGAYYSEAAAALVTSLLTGDGAHHYVDVRNNGTIAGLPDEAVVEVPAHVDLAGAHPVDVAPLAPEMLGLVQAVTAYEILTIEAAKTGIAARSRCARCSPTRWSGSGTSRCRCSTRCSTRTAVHLPQFGGDACLSTSSASTAATPRPTWCRRVPAASCSPAPAGQASTRRR